MAQVGGNNLLLNPGGGNVGIGTFNPGDLLHLTSSDADIVLETIFSPTFQKQSNVHLRLARPGPTVVVSDDRLGAIVAQGFDGSFYRQATGIQFQVDGAPGANDMPGRIVFSTTPDGSTTRIDRMTIKNDGNVGIGTTSPNTELSFGATDARITLDTADGSDNKALLLTGGGATTNSGRGAHINLHGNEHPGHGDLQLAAGEGNITFHTGIWFCASDN